MYFKEGMTVRVNKEITRVDGWKRKMGKEGIPISVGNYIIYAKEGEIGVVTEIFSTYSYSRLVYHAKVLIEGKIKTFRFTSLEIIN